jgi:spore germination protein KA
MKKAIRSFLRFDEPYDRFELKETESRGTPPFFAHRKEKQAERPESHGRLKKDLDANEKRLREIFRAKINPDLIIRPFRIGAKIRALAVCMNGMADDAKIADFILRPAHAFDAEGIPSARLPERFASLALEMNETGLSDSMDELVQAIAEGRTAVLFDGASRAILCDTRGFVSRPVGPPENEMTIMGPKEAFTENIRTNVTLLRRILKRPDFVCEFRDSGGTNRTKLVLAYLDGTVNPALLREVKRRLDGVSTDMRLTVGRLEQLIEDHSCLPLPQMLKTERPDRAASAVLDGRIALLMEGCPMAGVLPITVGSLLESGEDLDMRQPVGSIVRLVRMVGAILSTYLPAYFLALALHHPGQLSSEILETVIASRAMVFLPLWMEMIFLLLVFQLVREAGLRVPGSIGHAIGIIGGLLLGQAAVSANIVSTVVLIIVALTGLGNFTIPDYSAQVAAAYYRILLCIAATLAGLLGVTVTGLCATAAMCSVKSFGVPFFAPFAPVTKHREHMLFRTGLKNRAEASDWSNTNRRRA